MKVLGPVYCKFVLRSLLVLVVFSLPFPVQAQQNWNAAVGGQSADMSKQAVAFLP